MKELQAGFMTAVSGSAVQPHICIKFETVEAMQAAHLALLSLAQPGEGALTGWPCEIAEADFEANTVTVRMMTHDYRVRAGEYVLAPVTSTPTGDSNG